MPYEPIIPRARLGFIIPTSNRMVEPQMQRYMPAGVIPHFTRIGMTNKHKAPLEQQLPKIAAAAEMLAESKCDAVILQCTGTSMSGGLDMERHVIAAMEKGDRQAMLHRGLFAYLRLHRARRQEAGLRVGNQTAGS